MTAYIRSPDIYLNLMENNLKNAIDIIELQLHAF